MEQYKAILCRGGAASFRQASLTFDELARMRAETAFAPSQNAFLIKECDLAKLAAGLPAGFILDRGKKHPAKPLSHYLGKQTGIVQIRADYQNPGQTERGIRTLFAATAKRPLKAVYLIGIGETLFDQLWNRAGAPESTPENPLIPNFSEASNREPWHALLENHADLSIPDSLRSAYLGNAPSIDFVRRLIVLTAKSNHPVLIEGETGTGKEVVARQIHLLSSRSTMAFMPVNCGGIPSDLLESELFGHVQGAFTGAIRNKDGMWTLADEGTLFLDEIGELSQLHQAKVLRALEDGRYWPVGAEKEMSSSARIIAATNRNLRRLIETGRFREDLYYRLFAIRIRTPALRDHAEDIPELAQHFWLKIAGEKTLPLSPDVTEALKEYSWPGNARELRAFLMNVSMLAGTHPVTVPMVRAIMQERSGAFPKHHQDQ